MGKKFYVGPAGLEYNDEGYYNVEDGGITSVLTSFDTEAEARSCAEALTVADIRNGHDAFDYVLEDFDVEGATDQELLDEIRERAIMNGNNPKYLYDVISGD